MNGPEVIEQESGVAEFDASDRALNFAINGGEQRAAQGLADLLVPDDMPLIAQAIRTLIGRGQPAIQRTLNVAAYRNLIASLDPTHQWNPIDLRVPFKSASEAAQ
jgi:malonate decarboxylase beta subunit